MIPRRLLFKSLGALPLAAILPGQATPSRRAGLAGWAYHVAKLEGYAYDLSFWVDRRFQKGGHLDEVHYSDGEVVVYSTTYKELETLQRRHL